MDVLICWTLFSASALVVIFLVLVDLP